MGRRIGEYLPDSYFVILSTAAFPSYHHTMCGSPPQVHVHSTLGFRPASRAYMYVLRDGRRTD